MTPLDLQFDLFPPELDPKIRSLVDEVLWLVPNWCSSLYVKYMTQSDSEGAVADMTVHHSYRGATLRIYPLFFDIKYHDWERTEFLVHELVHVSVNQLADYARGEIKRLMGDDAPKYKASVDQQLEHECEVTVQDLTMSIMAKVYPLRGRQ